MSVMPGHAYRDGAQALLVTDKRGHRLQSTQGPSDYMPISELGSKAIYQVCAERFIPVVQAK
jgi:hypothetical protein